MSRQQFLGLLGAGAGALTLGDYGLVEAATRLSDPASGGLFHLNPAPATIDLGGVKAKTIAYNGMLPGPELRYKQGDPLHVKVTNHLQDTTSVHWHGIPVPNRMDGVPGLTQKPIAPGSTFDYHYTVPVSGTYWYHSHSAAQNDRGLYGPLILEPQQEPLSYDREYTLVLDDWRDGVGRFRINNDAHLYECDIQTAAESQAPARASEGAVAVPTSYPYYLINGRVPASPQQLTVKRGEVIRLRIINAAALTHFRVALAGHKMRVTHADGQPVAPVDVDALTIGMAERYDVLIHADNPGVWQFAAKSLALGGMARAILRYQGSHGAPPPASFTPAEMKGRHLSYQMLHAANDVSLPEGKPDITIPMNMESRFGGFFISVDGRFVNASDGYIHLRRNQHVRFVMSNGGTVLPHPMHLHGHFFHVRTGARRGPLKDTALLFPGQTITVDWVANNPGLWMFHCHNLYHMLNGMMQTFKVT